MKSSNGATNSTSGMVPLGESAPSVAQPERRNAPSGRPSGRTAQLNTATAIFTKRNVWLTIPSRSTPYVQRMRLSEAITARQHEKHRNFF